VKEERGDVREGVSKAKMRKNYEGSERVSKAKIEKRIKEEGVRGARGE
jgi:hypothetical protein